MADPSKEIELVEIDALPADRFATVLDQSGFHDLEELIERARALLEGRVVWCINSTARGGGVAEMLASLLAYTRGAGVDTRWAVIGAPPEFFVLTKRIHNRLHGAEGDGGPLGREERELYDRVLAAHHRRLEELVKPGDVVLVHDPQPAGLIQPLRDLGARVVWRLHVGIDEPNDLVEQAVSFLRPDVERAEQWVFSRDAFVWDGLDRERCHIIPPSIDVFSPKNQDLPDANVAAILAAAGITTDGAGGPAEFEREDGSTGRVERAADMLEERPLAPGERFVLQVSRWDRLKDHVGVLRGFAEHVDGAHLVLAGPATEAVADDPEGAEALKEVEDVWRALPGDVRERVHLARLPMTDRQENAAMVNALQRAATIVVQKSLAEGFGLTVAEGMWKGRPMVASAVGGIQDQVVEGETGFLVRDAHDLEGFGRAVQRLLDDHALAERLGENGRQRVIDEFLETRHLRQWVDLIEALIARPWN